MKDRFHQINFADGFKNWCQMRKLSSSFSKIFAVRTCSCFVDGEGQGVEGELDQLIVGQVDMGEIS